MKTTAEILSEAKDILTKHGWNQFHQFQYRLVDHNDELESIWEIDSCCSYGAINMAANKGKFRRFSGEEVTLAAGFNDEDIMSGDNIDVFIGDFHDQIPGAIDAVKTLAKAIRKTTYVPIQHTHSSLDIVTSYNDRLGIELGDIARVFDKAIQLAQGDNQ